MNEDIFYLPVRTPALEYAAAELKRAGCNVATSPAPYITHLLLPVPSFSSDGCIKGGGQLDELLGTLPGNVTIFGGNLNNTNLTGYTVHDLLQDPIYTAANANITAHCAIKVAMNHLDMTLRGCKVLVIGWGRIGKCLVKLLRGMEAAVTVAVRKETDLATLLSLGVNAVPIEQMVTQDHDVIFNTAPAPVLPDCPGNALKIELASVRGIGGEDVVSALGLPGKESPRSSGRLIADTVLRILCRRAVTQ